MEGLNRDGREKDDHVRVEDCLMGIGSAATISRQLANARQTSSDTLQTSSTRGTSEIAWVFGESPERRIWKLPPHYGQKQNRSRRPNEPLVPLATVIQEQETLLEVLHWQNEESLLRRVVEEFSIPESSKEAVRTHLTSVLNAHRQYRCTTDCSCELTIKKTGIFDNYLPELSWKRTKADKDKEDKVLKDQNLASQNLEEDASVPEPLAIVGDVVTSLLEMLPSNAADDEASAFDSLSESGVETLTGELSSSSTDYPGPRKNMKMSPKKSAPRILKKSPKSGQQQLNNKRPSRKSKHKLNDGHQSWHFQSGSELASEHWRKKIFEEFSIKDTDASYWQNQLLEHSNTCKDCNCELTIRKWNSGNLPECTLQWNLPECSRKSTKAVVSAAESDSGYEHA